MARVSPRARPPPLAGARQSADADRQGLFDRCRRRCRLAGHPGAWRHGLHRGDRRGRASTATPASRRSTKAPTASRRSISSPASCRSAAASMCIGYIAELKAVADAVRVSNLARLRPHRRAISIEALADLEAATRFLQKLLADGRIGRGAGRRHALSAAVRACRRRRLSGARCACRPIGASASRSAASLPKTCLARPRALEGARHRRRRKPCRRRHGADLA